MKFKTAKQGDAWCSVYNQLPGAVESACVRFSVKLDPSDPRMKELITTIFNLYDHFETQLRKRMQQIEQEFGDD